MKRLLILAQFTPIYLERLRRHFEILHESWLETVELVDPEALGERLRTQGIDYLVIEADFVLAETFAAAPNLRFVGVCRGEIGPHVDMEAAAEHGVMVVSTPGRNAVAVAELTLGLMLALARRIPQAHELVRAGQWDSALTGYGAWGGIELAGRTAGLIGLGAVGRAVAQRLHALDMRVLAFDPFLSAEQAAPAALVDLPTLLRAADFISLHCPLTPQTRHLLDATALAQTKPGIFLINTARAAVVDEDALLDALRSGRVAGAALDVHRVEPLPPNSPWLALDRVILTPHIGGASVDVIGHHSRLITEALEQFVGLG
ncbi:MAG: phosphoglycerate dehydrogenase [Anaerolineae bacterium]|uniref:NAD(P)-dependent oxidoreductase n=1 Tax=Candidatus Amarolinea dominans TaxID=3140696 RepID=UPI00313484E2|nr:phosphoglycerate dehydrogenase [Anaerolineae bacterium]